MDILEELQKDKFHLLLNESDLIKSDHNHMVFTAYLNESLIPLSHEIKNKYLQKDNVLSSVNYLEDGKEVFGIQVIIKKH